MNIPNLIVGSILLIFGRKLFWLFVGCMGFVIGFGFAEQFLGPRPDYILLLVGIVMGVLGALCAIFLQSLAVGVAGFMAGGYLTLLLLKALDFQQTQMLWLVCLAGGILGTILLVFIFDYALIVFSSIIGSALVVDSITIDPEFTLWVFAGLVIMGCAIQGRIISIEPDPADRRPRRKIY